ncbi:MAG: glucosaminidase domain-containing protein [Aliarcobacter sp.]|nr:glucosaminidase domain-containing protein [Aliarcobacter sp.]
MQLFKFPTKSLRKLFLGLCLVSFIQTQSLSEGFPSEYYEISDINESKNYFFNYMYEIIENENSAIKQEKAFVQKMLSSNLLSFDFDSSSFLKLLEIKQKYKIRNIYTLEEYLKKLDIIPPSLAIAQAAAESAWGKSRFTKEANNIFGHWTYNAEIGLLPKKRTLGESHFIRVFENIKESTKAYMLNLNRNLAYKSFREERYNLRKNNLKPDGLILSQTMLNYSGIAHDYLILLKDIISSNKLQEYDLKYYMKAQ